MSIETEAYRDITTLGMRVEQILSQPTEMCHNEFNELERELLKLQYTVPLLPRPPGYKREDSIENKCRMLYDWCIEARHILSVRILNEEVNRLRDRLNQLETKMQT